MTSPYLNNWSDEPEEEPVEHLGPRARALAEQQVTEFEEWFLAKYGYPLGTGPREHVHPQQEEADARRIERAERDREFVRVYGDGR